MKESKNKGVCLIAYQAASEPTMNSQVFPYIKMLQREGIEYSILTYETKDSIKKSRAFISGLNFPLKWRNLTYHHRLRFLVTCFDILCGMVILPFIVKKDKIGILHARGFIPAVLAFLPARLMGVKFFFDTRGFLADKYVGGSLLSKRSLTYKLMRWAEVALMKRSDFFAVETDRHAQVINNTDHGISKKMGIIPCCVDTDKFNFKNFHPKESNEFRLVYLGKIGTWYLIDQMLEFFRVLSEEITNSRFIFMTQDEPTYIYTTARKSGLDQTKITTIRPKMEEIPGLLASADAGIFFINPYERYNSSPIKFGEYLASGLPVVINKGIGDTEDITRQEKAGVIVNDLSVDSYKQAAQDLLELLKEKDTLRLRCRQAAQKHLSLEEGAGKYLNIYKRLLS